PEPGVAAATSRASEEDVDLEIGLGGVAVAVEAQVGEPLLGEHLVVDEGVPGALAGLPYEDCVGRVGDDLGPPCGRHAGVAAEQVLYGRGRDERARPQAVARDALVAAGLGD